MSLEFDKDLNVKWNVLADKDHDKKNQIESSRVVHKNVIYEFPDGLVIFKLALVLIIAFFKDLY